MKFYYTPIYGCRLLLAILFFLSGKVWSQQEYSLTGSVTDTTGLAIPGVHVQRLGTSTGSTTDFEGKFSIMISATDSLKLTYLGFKTRVLPVNNRTHIKVQLYPNEETLQEVVINAGYYTTTERERTGSIAKVTAKEIELQPLTNPLEALQGRMAGVEVVQQTGVPGAAPKIQIRGQNSLRNTINDNGNLPLYIVDGMPLNANPIYTQNQMLGNIGVDPLNTLDLNNIESIEILKDADATAIYGSRGANGVVLITTKKGGYKETQIAAQAYQGWSRVSHFVDLLNTKQYLALRRQAFKNDGLEPSEINAYDLLKWDQTRYTDWQKKLMGNTADLTQFNLNVSGANDNTSYQIGASYHKQGTVFPGDFSYKKNTFNLRLNHKSIDRKFNITLSANYGIDENNQFSNATYISNAFSLPPNAPKIYQEDGSLNWENSTWVNPYASLENDGTMVAQNLISNLSLGYHLAKPLKFKTNLGFTRLTSQEEIKIPLSSINPEFWVRNSHKSQHASSTRQSWIIEPQLEFTKSIQKHNLEVLIGTSLQASKNKHLRILATGYAHEHLIGNLAAADDVEVTNNQTTIYKYHAAFARIGYNWNKKYFLNLTGRRDGSSRFGKGKQFSNFGAIGAAWIFTEENWVSKQVPWLSFGKLRGSYGVTGNDQIGDYGYLDSYEATPGPGGLYPVQLANPDFSWEINRKLEAGAQLTFLKNRINTNITWFKNISTNQLVGYPLPSITGFKNIQANLPAQVENKGWELELSSLNIKNKQLSWRTSFNISFPKNQLSSFNNIENTPYANRYKVGQPLSIAILYKFKGIDPETGLYTVEDINQDDRFDFDDRVVVRNLGRKFFGGIQNQLNYKNFTLSFLVEFVKQKGYKLAATAPGRIGNSLKEQVAWDNLADGSGHNQKPSQSIYALLAYNNYAYNSNFAITDASFARLKTMSLKYRLPQNWLKPIGGDRMEVFIHAQNLFTLTNYGGLDPQRPGGYTLPALQSFTGGFKLNF